MAVPPGNPFERANNAQTMLARIEASLPRKCRAVFFLWARGWSCAEIAHELDISVKTVSAHLEAAKRRARTLFGRERERGNEPGLGGRRHDRLFSRNSRGG